MPEYERYPGEAPEAARRRISKNIKAKGNPGAGVPSSAVRPAPNPGLTPTGSEAAGLSPERLKLQKDLKGITSSVSPAKTKRDLMKKGYNFTRNLSGDLPDVGY